MRLFLAHGHMTSKEGSKDLNPRNLFPGSGLLNPPTPLFSSGD